MSGGLLISYLLTAATRITTLKRPRRPILPAFDAIGAGACMGARGTSDQSRWISAARGNTTSQAGKCLSADLLLALATRLEGHVTLPAWQGS